MLWMVILSSRHADLWIGGVVVGTVAVLCAVAGESADIPWANHDVANALYVGARVLAGDVLYVDWNYFVMPSVVFLSAGASLLGHLTQLRPETVLHLMLVGCALLGALAIRRALPEPSPRRTLIWLAELCLLVTCGFSAHNFAQREHFFVLLFVPYLVWRVSRQPASPAVYVLVACLGFTAMIKPHFVAGVALVEAFFLSEGNRRHWLPMVAGALSPLALLALRPAAVGGMIERMIPYQTGTGYDPYDASLAGFFASPMNEIYLALLALVGIASAWAVYSGVLASRAALLGIAVCLFFYASFLQQHKFFDYHAIPFLGTAYVSLAAIAGAGTERLRAPWSRFAAIGAAILALVWIGSGLLDLRRKFETRTPPALQRALTGLGDERLVALFTPSVELGFYSYVLEHGLDVMPPWTSHYTLPPLLGIADPGERAERVRAYMAPLLAKLEALRPGAVLFSPSQHSMGATTMHEVIVGEFGLFPTPAYRFEARTPQGWVVYRRVRID